MTWKIVSKASGPKSFSEASPLRKALKTCLNISWDPLSPAPIHPFTLSLEWDRTLPKVGSKLGKVMVLQKLRGSNMPLVTCKPSLLTAADQLPKELEDLTEASIVTGYVSNAVTHGVFVRFLNGLTGRAGMTCSFHRWWFPKNPLWESGSAGAFCSLLLCSPQNQTRAIRSQALSRPSCQHLPFKIFLDKEIDSIQMMMTFPKLLKIDDWFVIPYSFPPSICAKVCAYAFQDSRTQQWFKFSEALSHHLHLFLQAWPNCQTLLSATLKVFLPLGSPSRPELLRWDSNPALQLPLLLPSSPQLSWCLSNAPWRPTQLSQRPD